MPSPRRVTLVANDFAGRLTDVGPGLERRGIVFRDPFR
jgi:hypothetical protein